MIRSSARSWGLGALCLTGLVLLGGCPQPTPTGTVHDVAIRGMEFSPHDITIKVGDSVRWTNLDAVTHTVTSGDPDAGNAGALFDSGNLAPDKTFEFKFTTAGTYEYFCRIHYLTFPSMRHATVTVQ